MRNRIRWHTLVTILVVLGCGESTGPDAIPGTYTLQTIGGLDLPRAIQVTSDCTVFLPQNVCDRTSRLEVQEGTLRLNSDNTYRISTDMRRLEVSGAQFFMTAELTGSWSAAGQQISLDDGEGTERVGTVVGATATIPVTDNTDWAYRK